MDALDYPLPRETRESAVLNGDGGTSYGPFAFKIFDEVDVKAYVRPDGAGVFAEIDFTVTKTAALAYDTFSIELDEAITADDELMVVSARLHERLISVSRGGALSAAQMEKELSKQGSVIQELRRDVGRALRADYGQAGPVMNADELAIGDTLMIGAGNTIVPGPDAASIVTAEANGDRAETAAEIAEDARDATLAVLATATGFAPSTTWAAANYAATPVPDYLVTFGYAAAKDGGGRKFRHVTSASTLPGAFSTHGGTVYWEPVVEAVTPQMLGWVPGSETTAIAAALQDTSERLQVPVLGDRKAFSNLAGRTGKLWSVTGAPNWTIGADNIATKAAGVANEQITRTMTLVAGETYSLTMPIRSISGSWLRWHMTGGTSVLGTTHTTPGTKTETLIAAAGGNVTLALLGQVATVAEVDLSEVDVRRVSAGETPYVMRTVAIEDYVWPDGPIEVEQTDPWVRIIESVNNPRTTITLKDGDEFTNRLRRITPRVPLIIQAETHRGSIMCAAFTLPDSGGETNFRLMDLYPPSGFSQMYLVPGGRLSLDDVYYDGDGDSAAACLLAESQSACSLMIRAQTEDVVIDQSGNASSAVVDARYDMYCWIAGSADNRVIITRDSGVDVIAPAGADGYMNNFAIYGDGIAGAVRALRVERSGNWLLSRTGTAVEDYGFFDLAKAVTTRGEGGVYLTSATGYPNAIKRCGVGLEMTVGGRLRYDEPAIAFGTGGDANTVDEQNVNANLVDVEVSALASKSLGIIASGTVTVKPSAYPLQDYTNNGAHVLSPHASKLGKFTLEVFNGSSSGAVTMTGWTKVTGALGATAGDIYQCEVNLTARAKSITIVKVYP